MMNYVCNDVLHDYMMLRMVKLHSLGLRINAYETYGWRKHRKVRVQSQVVKGKGEAKASPLEPIREGLETSSLNGSFD